MDPSASLSASSGGATQNVLPPARLIGPDLLRFVAASLVIIRHWGITHEDNQTFISLFWRISSGADLGVDIFFVLSGFLVSGLLFQELKKTGTVSLTRFLIRRGFKIYPAYWAMFLFTLWLQYLDGVKLPRVDVWSMVFFFQNYLPLIWNHSVTSVWFVTWSLAVEEHFYLLLAGLFFILKLIAQKKRPLRMAVIPSVFFYTALFCLLARYFTHEFRSVVDEGVTKLPSHLRIDSLFFGVLLAYYWHLRWTEGLKAGLLKWRMAFWALGIFLLLTNFIWHSEIRFPVISYIIFYVGGGCLLLASLGIKAVGSGRLTKSLAWLGKHSYSVYLWHMAILEYLVLPIRNWEPVPAVPGVYFLFFFVSCWFFGVLMASLIEFRLLSVRDRLFPSFQKSK